MRRSFVSSVAVGLVAAVFFVGMGTALAQALLSQGVGGQEASVPRVMQYSGVLKDSLGRPLAGVQGVIFALYREPEGGSPLWLETQNVTADPEGRFAVLLGATTSEGVPLAGFSSGESRWLGVQAQAPGELEQPRVLLVSVPYALKAADAETLGGKPLSAFLLAEGSADGTAPARSKDGPRSASLTDELPTAATTTLDRVARFDGAGMPVDSDITNTGGKVGINTTSPSALLDVDGTNAGMRLGGGGTHQLQMMGDAGSGRLGQDGAGFFFASDTNGKAVRFYTNNGALNEWMRIASSGNVGIGTNNPAVALDIAGTNAALHLGGTGTHAMKMTGDASSGRLGQDNAGFFFASDTNGKSVRFLTNDGSLNERMLISSAGNVGIGTTTPGAKLDVMGNGTFSGNLTLGTPLGVASGGTGAAPGADDQILISDSTTAATWRGIPNCNTNNMLTYTASSNTFGCDVDDGAGGGASLSAANTFTTGPQTMLTGNDANRGLIVKGNSGTQSANLQEWQSSSSTTPLAAVNPAGFYVGPSGMLLSHGNFFSSQGTNSAGTGGSGFPTYSFGDGFFEANTTDGTNSFDDTVSVVAGADDLTVPDGLTVLDRPGTFMSARVRWITSPPSTQHKFYVLAGGVSGLSCTHTNPSGPPFLCSGFGFKANGSTLVGVAIVGGVQTEVALSPGVTLVTNTWVELLAIRRTSSIDFYVNGTLRGSASGTLPSSAGSTYEMRVENGSSNAIAGWQVGWYTLGTPYFPASLIP